MNKIPIGDRVIIKRNETEQKMGGLIIDLSSSGYQTGTVLKTGPGIYTQNGVLVPLTIQEGNTVHYVPNTGQEITIEGETLMMCREGDLLMFEKNGEESN